MEGRCCDACNVTVVLPALIRSLGTRTMPATALSSSEIKTDASLRASLGDGYADCVKEIAMTLPPRAERYQIAMLRATDKLLGTSDAADIEAMLY